LGLVALFCLYSLGLPLATLPTSVLRGEAASTLRVPAPPISRQIVFRSFEFVVAAWFFMFGASIGSFLNVVIYRTPRGISLLGSSRCPFCRSKIRFYHNIPVFAWISLRGRCRDCRLPISPRYPLVEFATGMIFLGLAVLELFWEGRNLPGEYGGLRFSVSWLVHHFPLDLVAVYLYHSTLLSILLSWALIKFDGYKLPTFYVILTIAIGLAIPAANPSVQPVSWISTMPVWLVGQSGMDRLDTSVVGLISGLSIGFVLSSVRFVTRARKKRYPGYVRDATVVLGVAGLFLGWQAVLSIAAIVTCTRLLLVAVPTAKAVLGLPTIVFMHVFLATALQVVLWDSLAQLTWWPGPQCSALAVAVVAMLTVLLTFVVNTREPSCSECA